MAMALEEVAPLAKNNDSLVVRLKYGDRTILLPGDAEKQVEYEMLAENDPAFLHADVLKVAHHGSKNSTMPELLNAVAPQVSIISAGEVNPCGHPSPELLQRLEESGTRVYRSRRCSAGVNRWRKSTGKLFRRLFEAHSGFSGHAAS